MRILEGTSRNIRLTGGIIEIEIGPGSIIPGIREEESTWITVNALIDSGAFTTVIRQGIAEKFDLPPSGTISAITPSNPTLGESSPRPRNKNGISSDVKVV